MILKQYNKIPFFYLTNNKLIFWACDYSDKTGEGNSRKFIKENFKKISLKLIL